MLNDESKGLEVEKFSSAANSRGHQAVAVTSCSLFLLRRHGESFLLFEEVCERKKEAEMSKVESCQLQRDLRVLPVIFNCPVLPFFLLLAVIG